MNNYLRIAAAATALSLSLTLTACSMSAPDLKSSLARSVVAGVPRATGALIGLNYDGSPERRGVGTKVYIDSEAGGDVAVAVDSALKTLWERFPVEPVSIDVSVVTGPMPVNAKYAASDGERLRGAAVDLGLDLADGDLRTVIVGQKELEQRYGPWKKPE